MKVYLDIFFLVNVEMDLVILLLENLFQRRLVRWRRLIFTAIAGGVFSTLFLISGIHRKVWLSVPVYLAGGGVMVRLAFGKTTVISWAKNVLGFYVAAFLLSGALMQLQSAWRQKGSMVFVLTGALAFLWITYKLMPFCENREREQARIMPVRLCYRGKWIRGQGFLDTGNHLAEPFSQKPVAIGNRIFLEKLWGEEEPVFRLIPFRAVGTGQGILSAFPLDDLEIEWGKNGRIRVGKTWVAVSDNDICADGEYDLILHPDMTNKTNLGG